MEDRKPIESRVYLDLPLYKEFFQMNQLVHTPNIVMRLVTAIGLVYLILGFDSRFTVIMFLVLSVFIFTVNLISYIRNRDGGLAYKRILFQNNTTTPLETVTLEEDRIITRNLDTGNELISSYEGIRFLAESKNCLILVNDLKMARLIDKRTLSGGSRDDIIHLLREKCPKLKKRIRNGFLGRVLLVITCVLVVLGIILGIATLLNIPQKLSGQLTNDLTYTEMAEELSGLGITITEQSIRELEEYDLEYMAEHGDYYAVNPDANKVFDLLCWEGYGIYDEQTWIWTPSESGVYWFDLEVVNPDRIYSDFLCGIVGMSKSLSFQDVTEDYSNADLEGGSGQVLFSFRYDGQVHTFTAEYNYDWFDLNMMFEVGSVLASDKDIRDLWYSSDGGQGILLYYGTPEQARILGKKAGLEFYDCVRMSPAN